jgi:DNA-binding MarR family transcriptional regulator
MSESNELLSAVREIRNFLELLAEPAIAERDRKLRTELKRIVGSSAPKAKAALLMTGGRTQSEIQRETGINKGNLSTLVKQLKENNLLSGDPKNPKLAISIPSNFFESEVGG